MMVIAEWSLPILILNHKSSHTFSLPRPGEEGSDTVVLVAMFGWCPARVNPPYSPQATFKLLEVKVTAHLSIQAANCQPQNETQFSNILQTSNSWLGFLSACGLWEVWKHWGFLWSLKCYNDIYYCYHVFLLTTVPVELQKFFRKKEDIHTNTYTDTHILVLPALVVTFSK